jgi:hypothetical protein
MQHLCASIQAVNAKVLLQLLFHMQVVYQPVAQQYEGLDDFE